MAGQTNPRKAFKTFGVCGLCLHYRAYCANLQPKILISMFIVRFSLSANTRTSMALFSPRLPNFTIVGSGQKTRHLHIYLGLPTNIRCVYFDSWHFLLLCRGIVKSVTPDQLLHTAEAVKHDCPVCPQLYYNAQLNYSLSTHQLASSIYKESK